MPWRHHTVGEISFVSGIYSVLRTKTGQSVLYKQVCLSLDFSHYRALSHIMVSIFRGLLLLIMLIALCLGTTSTMDWSDTGIWLVLLLESSPSGCNKMGTSSQRWCKWDTTNIALVFNSANILKWEIIIRAHLRNPNQCVRSKGSLFEVGNLFWKWSTMKTQDC